MSNFHKFFLNTLNNQTHKSHVEQKKNVRLIAFFCLVFVGVWNLELAAQESNKSNDVYVTDDFINVKKLNSKMLVLEDTTGLLNAYQVSSRKFTSYPLFKKKTSGLKKGRTYWGKLTLINKSKRNNWILYVGRGSNIELHINKDKKLNGSLIKGSLRDIKNSSVGNSYKFNLGTGIK